MVVVPPSADPAGPEARLTVTVPLYPVCTCPCWFSTAILTANGEPAVTVLGRGAR